MNEVRVVQKENNDTQFKIMTEGSVNRIILSLGIPATISMLVTNLYNIADTYFVSQIGLSASGAVGIVFGFMSVLQAIGFMFGQGAGSNIARSLGEKDEEAAGEYATISFAIAFILSIVIGGICLAFLNPFLRLLGSTETILPYAATYVKFIIAAAPFTVCGFVMNNILRFEGKANFAMIGLVSGALLNMIGDPILIFYFGLGIYGAGLSTAFSQIVSFFILLSFFVRGKTSVKLKLAHIKFDPDKFKEIVTIGFPSMSRQGLQSISTMLLNNYAAVYGDAAVAAMSIVSRIVFLVFAVGLGVGQGYQPVSGFNYGAKKYSRVRKAFRFTWILSEGILGTCAIACFFAAPYAVGIFRKDPEVLDIGILALRLQCVSMLFQPLGVVSNMTFQSTGKAFLAFVSSLFRNGLFFIPTIIIGTHFLGILGIQSAQAISDILTFITTVPLIIHYFKTLPADGK
ncbi:MAG: MATE family efflux transporter [Clostridiales bacterium]|nr:MATE family efflux transporter [Clostridiales bacterium]